MTSRKMKPHHDMGGDPAGAVTPDQPDDPIFFQALAQARFGTDGCWRGNGGVEH